MKATPIQSENFTVLINKLFVCVCVRGGGDSNFKIFSRVYVVLSLVFMSLRKSDLWHISMHLLGYLMRAAVL